MDAPANRSDEELFHTYRTEQDCEALGTLFRRRAEELLRLAVFLAPRPTEAEDLVQATFLSAIAHADQFRADGRVMSWLCGILTNHARMLRRSERRRPPAGLDRVVDDPADAALHEELKQALAQGIAGLPEPYRSVLQLHLESGLDSQQIGERLHRPPATVRKQMERALDRLRIALPIGLATTFAARADAAATANRATEAAQFVAPAAATTADAVTAAARATTKRWLVAAVSSLAAAVLVAIATSSSTDDEPGKATTDRGTVAARSETVAAPPVLGRSDESTRNTTAAAMRDADGACRLAVSVAAGGGAPIAGIDVYAVADDGRSLPERWSDADATHVARTDAAGVATLSGLPLGRYELALAGAPARRKIDLSGPEHSARLEAATPRMLHGIVVDPAGRGVADAEVIASETGLRGDQGHLVAVTKSDGSFAGATHVVVGRVHARHPGWGLAAGVRPDGDRELRIVLPTPSAPLDVEVVDSDGVPLPAAYVALVPRSQAGQVLPTCHARTDAAGTCRLVGPFAREGALVASAPGMAPTRMDIPATPSRVTIRLSSGRPVRGRIVRPDGTPVGGALVQASVPDPKTNEPASPLLTRLARTGDDGTFTTSPMPDGLLAIRVITAQAYSAAHAPVPMLLAAREFEHRLDGEPLQLTTREMPMLRGQLVDHRGRGLGGWTVFCSPRLGSGVHRQFGNRAADTDPDGWFTLGNLAQGDAYFLGALPAGASRDDLALPTPVGSATAGEAGLRIIVDPDAPRRSLRMRVLDGAGNVPRDAECELFAVAMPWANSRNVKADGTVAWSSLAPGEYLLSVGIAGHGTQTMRVQVSDDAQETDLGTITLAAPARASVRLSNAPPRAGVRVVLRSLPGDKFVAGATDAAGVAEVPPMPPGPAELLVHGAGIAPVRRVVDLATGANRIDVATTPAAVVPVFVAFDPAENPFVVHGPLHLQFWSASGELVFEDYPGAARQRGLFDCTTGLPPGEYRVLARSLWNASATARFTVTPDATAPTVRLHLAR